MQLKFFNYTINRIVLLIGFIIFMIFPVIDAYADKLFLINGKEYEGELIKQDDNEIIINTKSKTIIISPDEVAAIERAEHVSQEKPAETSSKANNDSITSDTTSTPKQTDFNKNNNLSSLSTEQANRNDMFLSFMKAMLIRAIKTVLVLVIILLVMTISMWILFKKAGQPGWTACIPFYNLYILVTKIAKKTVWWYDLILLPIPVSGIISFVASNMKVVDFILFKINIGQSDFEMSNMGTIAPYIFLPFCIVAFVAYILVSIDVARRFSKGVFYGLGLAILPFIFYPILAFGKSQYNNELEIQAPKYFKFKYVATSIVLMMIVGLVMYYYNHHVTKAADTKATDNIQKPSYILKIDVKDYPALIYINNIKYYDSSYNLSDKTYTQEDPVSLFIINGENSIKIMPNNKKQQNNMGYIDIKLLGRVSNEALSLSYPVIAFKRSKEDGILPYRQKFNISEFFHWKWEDAQIINNITSDDKAEINALINYFQKAMEDKQADKIYDIRSICYEELIKSLYIEDKGKETVKEELQLFFNDPKWGMKPLEPNKWKYENYGKIVGVEYEGPDTEILRSVELTNGMELLLPVYVSKIDGKWRIVR